MPTFCNFSHLSISSQFSEITISSPWPKVSDSVCSTGPFLLLLLLILLSFPSWVHSNYRMADWWVVSLSLSSWNVFSSNLNNDDFSPYFTAFSLPFRLHHYANTSCKYFPLIRLIVVSPNQLLTQSPSSLLLIPPSWFVISLLPSFHHFSLLPFYYATLSPLQLLFCTNSPPVLLFHVTILRLSSFRFCSGSCSIPSVLPSVPPRSAFPPLPSLPPTIFCSGKC
jgi:hypothetical protein